MEISYDPAKREKTLAERGLDFEDAVHVFAETTLTLEDSGGIMARRDTRRSAC